MTTRLNPEKHRLKLGFIPLTDCAPLVVAHELGFFRHYGLDVTLSRENSWANIRDKVGMGLLDGAHMLAGIPIAASLGLGSPKMPMLTALGLNLNGNAITVSQALFARMLAADPIAAATPATSAKALQRVIELDKTAGKPQLTFAMVYPVSSHHYLIRHWLASAGIDPNEDIRLIVIPPPQMVNYLRASTIDGYCVGEPWNTLAVQQGLGRMVITSHAIWNNHPEKVFGVSAAWAEQYPHTHQAVLRALLEACRWLDQPTNRLAAVKLLTQNRYVDTPAATLATAMTGTLQYTADQPPVPLADFNVFYRYAATFPWRSHAVLTIAQMYRWGQLAEALDIQAVAEQVYRPELYRQAAGALGLPYPIIDYKPEGVHATAWTLTEATQPIEMGPDLCLAGLRYTPNALMRYLKSLASFKGRSFIVASE